MMSNMDNLKNTILTHVYNSDEHYTEKSLRETADSFRKALSKIYPITDAEFKTLILKLREEVQIEIGKAHTLRYKDPIHQSWYLMNKGDGYYWKRYREYLIKIKTWNPVVVDELDDTTSQIMDDLGNPTDKNHLFNRRGLLLGDVQSGKTATYTAICNKAADAGYRVIIILAGMTENLRMQTQERLDSEFVGRESRYSLNTKVDPSIKNQKVGVGKILQIKMEKRVTCFTSVETDFNKKVLLSNDLTLQNLKGVALFIVKKNKSILNNLHRWLIENNADEDSNKIDLPLLLIDDEADNASVNTSSDEHDPTAINIAIRKILDSFYQASYLGITATPFANIFINQEEVKGKPEDLFPRDFITVLPTPSNYIGADRIFGIGIDDVGSDNRQNGEFDNALTPILNVEMERYFRFSHKKELSYTLSDLPDSLKNSIYYFILVSAIRNMRGDATEHHSMLVNVSRFTQVQNKLEELIREFLSIVKAAVRDYGKLTENSALKIPIMKELKDVWDNYNLGKKAECDWETMQKEYLYESIERIETRSVNQTTGPKNLNYFKYKEIGLHVIAIGGNSLSRGLTLEGLCVSYFYRNSQMYDTLLQMGRWFGYRNNYSDLFRIWLAEDAIDWYGFVSDATLELKEELKQMERENKTPEEFGLRVRQNPSSLIVTARNKMRTGTVVNIPISLSGRLIETPRLKNEYAILQHNEDICRKFIQEIVKNSGIPMQKNKSPEALIWREIDSNKIIQLITSFDVHPWNLNYQSKAIADFINESPSLQKWDVAIPFGSSKKSYSFSESDPSVTVVPEERSIVEDYREIRISGRHVKVGSGTSTRIGLSDKQIALIKDTISKKNKGKTERDKERITDRTYLIKERNPILMIHVLEVKNSEKSSLATISNGKILFALALGFPNTGEIEKTATYVVNMQDLRNWIDIPDSEDEDGDI